MPAKRLINGGRTLPRGVSVPRETGEPKGVIEVNVSLVGIDGVNEK
jgi:hypothetical protein